MCLNSSYSIGSNYPMPAGAVCCMRCNTTQPAPARDAMYMGHYEKWDSWSGSSPAVPFDLFVVTGGAPRCVTCKASLTYAAYACDGGASVAAEAGKDLEAWIDEVEKNALRERVPVRK